MTTWKTTYIAAVVHCAGDNPIINECSTTVTICDEAAVFARFGLPSKLPQCVKDADRVLLRTEQRDLMGADGHQWSFTEGTAPLPERIEPLPPAEAKWLFLTRYAALRPNARLSGDEQP